MTKVAERIERMKTVAGMDDIQVLEKAGIRTVWDYIEARPQVVSRLTHQKTTEVKDRQRAARVYLSSGLDPGVCLRLVQAGVRNSCQILFKDVDHLIEGEQQNESLELAKTNVAYDNVRNFVSSKRARNKKEILAEISKLKPDERRAAIGSVEVLSNLPDFDWLNAEVENHAPDGIEASELKKIVTALPDEEVKSIMSQLQEGFGDVIAQKQSKSVRAAAKPGVRRAASVSTDIVPLIDIEGIALTYAARLQRAGINTVEDLRKMSIGKANLRTRISVRRLWKWQAAAILLQIQGMDTQIAEALVEAGYHDLFTVAQADPMDIYRAIEAARNPRSERNIIPDSYKRVITPTMVMQAQRAAYNIYASESSPSSGGKGAPAVRHTLSIRPIIDSIPALESNYGPRPSNRVIRYIVIHALFCSLQEGINEFKRTGSKKSAHYLVGQDGRVVQMVEDWDVAFHATNSGGGCRGESAHGCSGQRSSGETWDIDHACNCQSIGIELEDRRGYLSNPNWATDQMYDVTAQLVGWLSDTYGISKRREDRKIIGHSDVHGRTQGKDDPGQYWDWNRFFGLLNPSPPHQESDGGKGGGGGGGGGGGKGGGGGGGK